MPKIGIWEDELYPYYGLQDVEAEDKKFHGPIVEVPAAQLIRWKMAIDEFQKVQDEIGKLHDAHEE